MTNEAKVTIVADGSQVNQVLAEVSRNTAAMGQSFARAAGTATQSTKQLNAALRQVPAQITDIVTGLASGQAPLTVLLQQGGQLKDVFGGIGPAVKAVGGYVLGLINPYTLAAGAVALLGAAYASASAEEQAFAKAIILSGNVAGTSVARLQALSAEVANASGATRGRAAEVLTALVEQGKLTEDQFARVATAALNLEKATGKAAEDTAKDFALIAKSPAEALKKLDEGQNAFTASTYRQVTALLEQGRSIEAARVLADAYADTINGRSSEIVQNLSIWEKGWNAVGAAAKGAWDRIKDVGRTDTLQEQIAQQKAFIERLNAGEENGNVGVAQDYLAKLEKRLASENAINAAKAEQNTLERQQKEFIDLTTTAADKAAAANSETLNKLRTDYLATLEGIRQASGGKDPLNTAAGIIAAEKYRAKIAEIAQEVNKTAISGEQALREKLNAAMEDGRQKAEKLKEEIQALNEQISKNLSGQGEFAQKAQDRRDKSLTPEQADATAQKRAQDALQQAQSLAVYAQNAAIDGRAEQAQQYAKQAADLLSQAGKAADKIKDDDLAATIYDQLNTAQTNLLQGQKAIKEQQLAEQQAQADAQAAQLSTLEERLTALKSGAVVKVDVPTDAAIAQANAIKAAIDAAVVPRVAPISVQQVGGAGDTPPPDLPARAYGGPLPGFAPHDRADNRLFWGTPGEWVMQLPAVRYYGQNFMRLVNSMQIPRRAFGGQIGVPEASIPRISVPRLPSLSPASVPDPAARTPLVINFPGGESIRAEIAQNMEAEVTRILRRAALAHSGGRG